MSNSKPATKLRRQKDDIENLLQQLPSVAYSSLPCHPEITNILPFYWAGYELNVRYTYRLSPISNLEQVWEGLSSNIRSDIRKAKKQVKIEFDLGTDKFLDVYEKTFKRQKLKLPFNKKFFGNLDYILEGRDCRRQLFAVDHMGRVHAGVYLVWDDRCAYYLLGGGDPDLRSSGATSLLLWKAIELASAKTDIFDFEGSMLEPIERFFRAFGATQTPYYQVTKTSSICLRLAKAVTKNI